MTSKRIMLIGPSGSGKDTMAKIIIDIVPNCHSLAFAKEVKILAENIIDYIDNAEGTQLAATKELPDEAHRILMRPFWQWLGTDLFRNHADRNFWLRKIDQKVRDIEENYRVSSNFVSAPSFVITDCRYENEFHWGLDNGFVIVRVQGEWRQPTGLPGHTSEKDHLRLKEHLSYSNRGSIEDMRNWVSNVLLSFCREYWYDFSIPKEEH